jgi:transposase
MITPHGCTTEPRGQLGARKLLVKARDLDNAVRALLRSFGLKEGQIGEGAFAERVRELVEGRATLQTVLAPLLEAHAAFIAQCDHLHRLVPIAVRSGPVCRA